ncbi:hypothetical protein Tco_0211833 [Tanacetum coccineum]
MGGQSISLTICATSISDCLLSTSLRMTRGLVIRLGMINNSVGLSKHRTTVETTYPSQFSKVVQTVLKEEGWGTILNCLVAGVNSKISSPELLCSEAIADSIIQNLHVIVSMIRQSVPNTMKKIIRKFVHENSLGVVADDKAYDGMNFGLTCGTFSHNWIILRNLIMKSGASFFDLKNLTHVNHEFVRFLVLLYPLRNKTGVLRAISDHMLGAAGVQIPEDNLDNLHSLREEDRTSEIMDPHDLLGSFLLAYTD